MYHINFNNPIHVHFIGIGGISMSGLAHILRDKNFTVSGSDAAESALTKELTAAGCHIVYSQTADNITSDIDLVVYTAAIRDTNPELSAARAAGIPTITRAELLGQIMTNYKTAAVPGRNQGTCRGKNPRQYHRRTGIYINLLFCSEVPSFIYRDIWWNRCGTVSHLRLAGGV